MLWSQFPPVPVDSLADLARAAGLDCTRLSVAIEPEGGQSRRAADRSSIKIVHGDAVHAWQVPSLRALLRGDREPPDLTSPTDEFMFFMMPIERHVLTYAAAAGAPAYDDDIIEAFSALRRRPDGRSGGPVHDALWQAVGLAVGLRPTSPAELAAAMGRLERSARHWRQYAGSTAYSEFLSATL